MSIFAAAAALVTLTAVFAFFNERYLRLPTPIGVMLTALVVSAGLALLGGSVSGAEAWARSLLEQLDFDALLLNGMLSFLLFAGALHVNLDELLEQKWTILTLATVSVVASTLLVGTLIWWPLSQLGVELPYAFCLLFGALISPTDPIAVLSILKRVGTPRKIETLITGESLFNDGVGVVVFSLILAAVAGEEVSAGEIGLLFLEEALGGALFGLALGLVAYWMVKQVDNYTVEILITLSVVMGGYGLAQSLHTSGPIAMVVAGLFLGNRGRHFAMSERTRQHLDTFWEMVDEILNAVLFVIIGMELLFVELDARYLVAGAVAIPLVLLVRWICVGVPLSLPPLRSAYQRYTVLLMTWGGLRGGISIALVLSLAASPERRVLMAMTYIVVVFSILVQGLTVSPLARLAREQSSNPYTPK